jgi:hypothetical protein
MLRISIPKGQTLDGVEGPFVFVADSYELAGTTEHSGEWLITASGPQRMSEWMTEETAVVIPMAFSVALVCLVNWMRRFMVWAVFLSPFALASGATYRLDVIPSASINYPATLSGTTLKMWLYFPGSGQVTDGVSVTVLESTNGKPSKFKTVSQYQATQNFYAIITNGGTPFETRTKLKWIDPYEVGSGTEPQSNDYGNYAGEQPTDENGVPISDPTNPAPAPDIPNKAAGNFKNPFGSPATPVLTIRPKDGSPPTDARFPTLNPGQEMPWNMEFPKEFDWEIGWDLGDGVVVYPGGGGNTGTSAPLPVGSPTPPSGGDGSSGAITTPPLPTPDPAPSGDVAAAVNRHAALTQAYGEAARTAAGITNNNLDALEGLFSQALTKLSSIDGKTVAGGGGGTGSVTIEGDALGYLQGIDEGVNRTTTPPATIEPPSASVTDWSSKAKTSAIQRIRDAMSSMEDSLGSAKQGLGLGANYTAAPLASSFVVLGHTYTFNLETYAWAFNIIYYVLLGLWSASFVWRFIEILRGVFV